MQCKPQPVKASKARIVGQSRINNQIAYFHTYTYYSEYIQLHEMLHRYPHGVFIMAQSLSVE